MIVGELVGLSALVLANAGVSIGIYKYFDNRIDRVNADNDQKISRIYVRLDEHKKGTEEKYVRIDMCKIMHSSTSDNLKSIEGRMEVRFDKLEQRVEDALKSLDDKMLKLLAK